MCKRNVQIDCQIEQRHLNKIALNNYQLWKKFSIKTISVCKLILNASILGTALNIQLGIRKYPWVNLDYTISETSHPFNKGETGQRVFVIFIEIIKP